MQKLTDLITGIRVGLTQQSASKKDEVEVMQAMLNDTSYEVGVYTKDGLQETFNPSAKAREIVISVLQNTAQLNAEEAKLLGDSHEFSKKEAQNFIDVSKEFINTYTQTNRRLPLGGRENSDVTLIRKEVAESTRAFPYKTGTENGKDVFEIRETVTPAHESLKSSGSCPAWLKN